MSYLRANTLLFVILIVLTACSDTKLMTPETEGEKLQILYNDAMELVKSIMSDKSNWKYSYDKSDLDKLNFSTLNNKKELSASL